MNITTKDPVKSKAVEKRYNKVIVEMTAEQYAAYCFMHFCCISSGSNDKIGVSVGELNQHLETVWGTDNPKNLQLWRAIGLRDDSDSVKRGGFLVQA